MGIGSFLCILKHDFELNTRRSRVKNTPKVAILFWMSTSELASLICSSGGATVSFLSDEYNTVRQ
jgi:hypothetical protein